MICHLHLHSQLINSLIKFSLLILICDNSRTHMPGICFHYEQFICLNNVEHSRCQNKWMHAKHLFVFGIVKTSKLEFLSPRNSRMKQGYQLRIFFPGFTFKDTHSHRIPSYLHATPAICNNYLTKWTFLFSDRYASLWWWFTSVYYLYLPPPQRPSRIFAIPHNNYTKSLISSKFSTCNIHPGLLLNHVNYAD